MSMPQKDARLRTIAVDIDDVLAISAQALVDYSNTRWGTRLTVEDYDEDWGKMWQVDLEEERRRSDEWHVSGGIVNKSPKEEGLSVLQHLSSKYRLVIATSRRKIIQEDTRLWIEKHYKGIFSEIHYSGIWDERLPNSHALTKAQLCREIGADYLIDDQVKHCLGAAEAGVEALLFGDYKWNREVDLPRGVIRVKDWPAVKEYFDARS